MPEDGRLDRNRSPKINKYKVALDGAVYTVYCINPVKAGSFEQEYKIIPEDCVYHDETCSRDRLKVNI